ncbi:hypothetical protein [Fructilactobacillus carniphilus]|uniref:Uncharacterized protein n=1 Tax=Fructilactobacillus carniphilus TaxID=2940297 RepID=A0ABY5BUX7_9LACO|nr:hypothetical protein [Fructilactobacillus carniphilus]USS90026.1 hypothetical protein M3M37_03990 [Fructilactobacillus carniphilus]
MHYELVNKIDVKNPSWPIQKQRLMDKNGQLITLAPDPNLRNQLNQEKINGINVLDQYTGRKIDFNPDQYLYFNQVPTVTGAEIFMNPDFSVDVIADGDVIGNVILRSLTRRHVQQVNYVYPNGERDFTEIYASDGKKFSNEIYTDNQLQRTDFYDNQERPVVRFYYDDGQVQRITIENFTTMQITATYEVMHQFFAAKLKQILTEQDTVNINYLGIEMWSLDNTKSHNTLYLTEDPLNSDGKIKRNLYDILLDNIKFIQSVHMNQNQFEKIKSTKLSTEKIVVE